MTDLIFEDIGGQELINIARNDILNGIDILYNPIKNISSLYLQYNPNNILALQGISEAYFSQFAINFGSRVPSTGTGPNSSIVYLDEGGNLIIELVNMKDSESVEVQIQVNGSKFSDTIYEVNE
jgi:alpha-L-arabinofuranosidase